MDEPAEPRILTEDIREVICTVIDPGNPDAGEAVINFADRAGTSTRTIYRVLSGTAGETTQPPSMLMEIADRLVIAAGRHLSECRALTASGDVVSYGDT